MAVPTTTYRMWKHLAERPGGTLLFSAAAMVRVPYFASIVPHVVRMEPGFAEVTVPKWFFVKRVEVVPPLQHPPAHLRSRSRTTRLPGSGGDSCLTTLCIWAVVLQFRAGTHI
jgi:hypothetical protein